MREEKSSFCALCKSRCGATYIVEDGQLVGAKPAPDHPTGKSLCVKGKAAPEILYHPDRLLTPLKRTNPKSSNDPGWMEISWEQALREIGERLRAIRDAHGIEAVAVSTTTPSGTALGDGEEWIERLIQVSGTPNWVSTTEVCNWHKDFAHAFTFGSSLPYPDYRQADLIVLWDFNPSSVWLDQATQIADARARGAKIVVVDPRRFGFAIGADQWLRVRPGADGILALGIMRILIESGQYDTSFVRRWTNAAFLVREDNGEFLRGVDLQEAGSSRDSFVLLGRNGQPAIVDRHAASDAEFDAAMINGTVIAFALAAELGLNEQFFNGSIRAGRQHILAPSGITLEALEAHPEGIRYPLVMRYRKYAEATDSGVQGFATETGQVELYSALLKRHAQPAVPSFSTDALPGNEEYPFVLTTAKTGYFRRSQDRQIASLRKREPEPSVNLAPEAAEELGLEIGDWATIETHCGTARMRVKLDNSLDPRVVRASYGWWQANEQLKLPGYDAFSNEGSNYNMLIGSARLDPVSGAAAHRSESCRAVPLQPARGGWRGYQTLRIVALRRVADEVTAVSLQSRDGAPLPDYQPGQHVILRWQPDAASAPLIRCYSLTGSAQQSDRGTYDIAVRFVPAPVDRPDLPDDRMSGVINRQVAVNDVVEVRVPTGQFILPMTSDRPVVLVAGGIGITPFLSYLETLARRSDRPRVHLSYANRNPSSEAFADRLAALQAKLPRLTISRHWSHWTGPAPAGVKLGYIDVGDILREDFDTTPAVFFCGPPAMTRVLKEAMKAAGHPADLVFEEAFTIGSVDESALPEGPYSVTFVRSGKTMPWDRKSGSLLDIAEAGGITIASGCRAGQCETCEAAILEGETMHRIAVGHPGGGTCLACQAVPRSDLLVDA